MTKQSYRRVPKTPAYLLFIITAFIFAVVQSSQICSAETSSIWTGNETLYSILENGSAGGNEGVSGKIKGHIFDQNNQAPLANIAVFAQQADSFEIEVYEVDSGKLEGSYPVTVSNTMTYQAITDEDGAYSLKHLPAGNYKVWVETDNSIYAGKYYQDSSDLLSATPVNLADDTTVSGIDFHLNPGGFIAGRVTKNINAESVSGITISAFYYGTEHLIASTQTGTDGTYLLTGLPSGKFTVKAEKKPEFVDAYFGGTSEASSAQPVTVTASATTSSIDFSLTSYARLAGRITGEDGNPIPGIRVNAFDFNAPVTPYLRPLGQTVTGADGTYLLKELLAGQYRIATDAATTYVTNIYENKSISEEPSAVTLHEGQSLTGINFSLSVGGTIQGLITAEATGLPIASVKIEAFDLVSGDLLGHVFTNPMGKYSLSKLPTGSFLIKATSPQYISKYFPNAADASTAVEVPTAAGMIRGNVDFQLAGTPVAHVGTISGSLRSAADNTPIDRACVNAFTILTNRLDGFDCSDNQGTYLIEGLPDGDYRLCSRAGTGFINECYNDISLENSSNANPVSIINGEGASGIDFSLTKLGSIVGTIFRAGNSDENLIKIGSYEVTNLPPGEYILKIKTTGTGYREKYYRDASTMAAAMPVIIGGSQTLQQGIDFTLAVGNTETLASISGKVTRSTGTGLSYIPVNALDPVSQEIIRSTYSGADGDYLLADLAPGSYLVQAATNGKDYLPLYFANSYSAGAATEVSVTAGQKSLGIDFQLTTGASIRGYVMIDPSGEAVANVKVCATSTGQAPPNCSVTSADGNYAILGLTPGMYAVYTDTTGTPHHKILAKEYFNDKEMLATADLVQIDEGETVTGMSFALSRLGSISGKVVDQQTSAPISGLRISLVDATSRALIPSLFAMSTPNGTYTILGVPGGSYLVQALSSGTLYRGEYFDNSTNMDTAQTISIEGYQTLSDIDFALAAGGAITGTVNRADTGAPLSGLLVHILDFTTGKGIVAGRTGSDGRFSIRGLASGDYKVYVPASQTIFQPQYFNATTELESATQVQVESGKENNNINFVLKVSAP